jgi:hypothetical protein
VARDRLRPVQNIQEDRVQQEEPVYAEVHQEDPDAIGGSWRMMRARSNSMPTTRVSTTSFAFKSYRVSF